ncbi:MAG: DUF47 family protein [Candidatus Nanopelagicales bacterium]|jgi:predicted phosphate transport protein (TIGR00153 family)
MVKFKRPDAIQKMMSEAASHLPDATMAFYSLVTANPEARPALAKKLGDIESEADERQVKLMRKVATTFITPYDREDIYGMFETLDDIVDSLDHAGRLVVDFEMLQLPEELATSAKELVKMSEQARDATEFIKKPNKMEKALFAVNDHENELDTAYRRMLRNALQPGADPIEAIKLKILADSLEQAATNIERFTRALSIAAIKET